MLSLYCWCSAMMPWCVMLLVELLLTIFLTFFVHVTTLEIHGVLQCYGFQERDPPRKGTLEISEDEEGRECTVGRGTDGGALFC